MKINNNYYTEFKIKCLLTLFKDKDKIITIKIECFFVNLISIT